MGESSDLIGVSKYILEVFGKSKSEKCHNLRYRALITPLLETKYTGGMSK